MHTSIEGGSTESELIELTVNPKRPPGPSVATIPTVETALRIAARKELASTIPSLPVGEELRVELGCAYFPEAETTPGKVTLTRTRASFLSIAAFLKVSAIRRTPPENERARIRPLKRKLATADPSVQLNVFQL